MSCWYLLVHVQSYSFRYKDASLIRASGSSKLPVLPKHSYCLPTSPKLWSILRVVSQYSGILRERHRLVIMFTSSSIKGIFQPELPCYGIYRISSFLLMIRRVSLWYLKAFWYSEDGARCIKIVHDKNDFLGSWYILSTIYLISSAQSTVKFDVLDACVWHRPPLWF